MLETDDPIKYVFLDEFERVSSQYQDAMKAFIETYHKNVRFILTTNHINKISDGIKSRFTCIDFDYQDSKEEKYLKQELYKKAINTICPSENITISKEQLVTIINKKFPDLRGVLVLLQNFKNTGEINTNDITTSNKTKLDLYETIYDKSLDYEKIYHFIMSSFGPDKIDIMFNLLSRGFVEWYILEKKGNVDKLFEVNYIISDYASKLETQTDPVILGMTVIGKIRQIVFSSLI